MVRVCELNIMKQIHRNCLKKRVEGAFVVTTNTNNFNVNHVFWFF